MSKSASLAAAIAAFFAVAGAAIAQNGVDPGTPNDFPTVARADYVFACMSANGQSRDALTRCSCSIDVIASIMPYARYEQAEVVLMMRQGIGQSASAFRSTGSFDDLVADLRRAQAEAEIRCFP